jgi:hypothetical protein
MFKRAADKTTLPGDDPLGRVPLEERAKQMRRKRMMVMHPG